MHRGFALGRFLPVASMDIVLRIQPGALISGQWSKGRRLYSHRTSFQVTIAVSNANAKQELSPLDTD